MHCREEKDLLAEWAGRPEPLSGPLETAMHWFTRSLLPPPGTTVIAEELAYPLWRGRLYVPVCLALHLVSQAGVLVFMGQHLCAKAAVMCMVSCKAGTISAAPSRGQSSGVPALNTLSQFPLCGNRARPILVVLHPCRVSRGSRSCKGEPDFLLPQQCG